MSSNRIFYYFKLLNRRKIMEKNEIHVNSINSHDCISGNTRIVLMDPNGCVIYTTASYFKHFSIGMTVLHGWKILSTDGKFTDLISVSVNTGVNYINAIRASHGVIKVTDNQIISIYRKKEYMEIPAKEIQKYDCLIEASLKDIIKEEYKLQEINLIDLIPIHSNISIVGTPKLATLLANFPINGSEEDRVNLQERYTREGISLDGYKLIRGQLADVIDENKLGLIIKKSIIATKPIPVKYKLTREFGRFYGLLYSEGCVTRNSICITNSDPEIIDFAKMYLAKLLHRDKATVCINANGCSDIRLNSALFASLFKNGILGSHYGSGNLKLPNWFFFANDEFLKGFLSGVIDGDGYVNVPMNYIKIYTSSETFAEDIQAVCSRFGYITSVNVTETKGRIIHIRDKTYTRNFDEYQVTINNLDIVDMNLHDSIKARKLNGYISKRKYSKKYLNRVHSIKQYDFNGCVYDFETGNHYFAAGTQLLHDCTNTSSGSIHRY